MGLVRSFRVSLALALLLPGSAHAASATSRFVRTNLDDEVVVAAPLPAHGARLIRSTLDEPSHGEFPLYDERLRLIRASLDADGTEYVRLDAAAARARYVRTTLD